jgi:hypothetical protein
MSVERDAARPDQEADGRGPPRGVLDQPGVGGDALSHVLESHPTRYGAAGLSKRRVLSNGDDACRVVGGVCQDHVEQHHGRPVRNHGFHGREPRGHARSSSQ